MDPKIESNDQMWKSTSMTTNLFEKGIEAILKSASFILNDHSPLTIHSLQNEISFPSIKSISPFIEIATIDNFFSFKEMISSNEIDNSVFSTVTLFPSFSSSTIPSRIQSLINNEISWKNDTNSMKKENSFEMGNKSIIASRHQFKQALYCYPGANRATVSRVDINSNFRLYKSLIPSDMNMIEQAMFLTNVIWETSHLQFMKEIACRHGHCRYGKYYGRGCLQLTWKDNYREASIALYGNDTLILNPNLVAHQRDAWRTAIWFWNERVRRNAPLNFVIKKDLGATIKIINGKLECEKGRPKGNAFKRLKIFNCILKKWKLLPFGNLDGCR